MVTDEGSIVGNVNTFFDSLKFGKVHTRFSC